MPRGPRIVLENIPYHIVMRGNGGGIIFHEDKDKEIYLMLLKRYKEKFMFKLYHYALMMNHIHLLLEVSRKEYLQKLMQGLSLAYSQRYRSKYKTSGYLWQGRFKSMIIERDVYLLECARYIERNPVRAGLVQDPSLYPWSSYNFYAYGKQNNLIDVDPLYLTFGSSLQERREKYRDYVLCARDSELKKLMVFQDGGVLGSVEFCNKLKEILGRIKQRSRGRPKIK